mmetsp:Transcript_9631/g.29188  ORF Transcript_9631/g.29188 Transcript_9631/m.29188 type:complete len:471 (+) Transcript_9631:2692-4104(+)
MLLRVNQREPHRRLCKHANFHKLCTEETGSVITFPGLKPLDELSLVIREPKIWQARTANHVLLLGELQGEFVESEPYVSLVLERIDRTGRKCQHASRLEQHDCCSQKLSLKRCLVMNLGLQIIAKVQTRADAQRAARGINEDAVERLAAEHGKFSVRHWLILEPIRNVLAVFDSIIAVCLDNGQPKFGCIASYRFHLVETPVKCDHPPLVLHQSCDMRRLAAWACAHVQYQFARLGVQHMGHRGRRQVLQVRSVLEKSVQRGSDKPRLGQSHRNAFCVTGVKKRLSVHLGHPVSEVVFSGCGIDAKRSLGRLIEEVDKDRRPLAHSEMTFCREDAGCVDACAAEHRFGTPSGEPHAWQPSRRSLQGPQRVHKNYIRKDFVWPDSPFELCRDQISELVDNLRHSRHKRIDSHRGRRRSWQNPAQLLDCLRTDQLRQAGQLSPVDVEKLVLTHYHCHLQVCCGCIASPGPDC